MGRLGSGPGLRGGLVAVLVLAAATGCAVRGDGTGGGTGGDASRGGHSARPTTPAPEVGSPDAGQGTDARTTPLRRGERFTDLPLPGGSYRPAAPSGGKDDYRCFLVDPALTSDAFLTGAEVLPGRPEVVHHAILFRVPPSQVAAAQRRDSATPGKGWTCFGGSGIPAAEGAVGALDSAPWLAAWAPGGGESVFPGRTGIRLAAGSRIVLQVHYNLRAVTNPDITDDTAVRLRLAPGTAGLQAVRTMLLVAPVELPCTADERGPLCDREQAMIDLVSRFGEQEARTVAGLQLLCGGSLFSPRAGPTQHCDRKVNDPMVVRAVAGHMHLLGRSISVTLDPGTAGARTLFDRKVWDFDNQRAVPLRKPVHVRRGDTLRVTCTHDAALRAMVPELSGEQPRYVTWGEGTSDEMCLGIVLYTRR